MTEAEFRQRFILQYPQTSEPDYPLTRRAREASVLLPILCDSQLQLVLTTRASHLRHHPGQVSFPGGALDEQDANLAAAAIREAHEEIDLHPRHVTLLGQLADYRTISGYNITPFVGLIDSKAEFIADPNEVDEVFTVPLTYALNRQHHDTYWIARDSQPTPIYFIRYQQKMIWGATAALIRNLSHIIYPQ